MKTLMMILALLANLQAFAGQERGGGDEAGLEFKQSYATALKKLQAEHPDLLARLGGIESLVEKQKSALVLVVETPLEVIREGVKQNSVAVNDPARNLILVHRARWAKLNNSVNREALALHEYASLAGSESTGNYEISSEYLARHGEEANALTNPDRELEKLKQAKDQEWKEMNEWMDRLNPAYDIAEKVINSYDLFKADANRVLNTNGRDIYSYAIERKLKELGYRPKKDIGPLVARYLSKFRCEGYDLIPQGKRFEAKPPKRVQRVGYTIRCYAIATLGAMENYHQPMKQK